MNISRRDASLTVADAFRALAQTVSEPQLLLTHSGRIVAANRLAGSLFGCSTSELVGKRLHDRVAADGDLDALVRLFSRTAAPQPGSLSLRGAGGKPIDCRCEGARLPIEAELEEPLLILRLRPRTSRKSRFQALSDQVVDLRSEVARRRQAELLLAHQKDLLELIVGNHPLADTLAAIATFVEEHSERSLCSILLLSDDGKHLLFGAAPSLPGEYNQAIDGLEIGPQVGSCGTAAHSGETVVVDDIATDPRWADYKGLAAQHQLAACWSEPVRGADGEVLATLAMYYREPGTPSLEDRYLTAIGVDLTAIAIMSERSRAALRARAEQLAEADRRKDRFLAMLSHELRNPLAPMVNTLEVLSARAGEGELADHVARLRRQTTHLSRLVDDLLDISRIAHGAVELKIRRVDLRESLGQAVDSVREAIDQRDQSLSLPETNGPLWVDGDVDRLRQVFANLLTNASKYTPPGGHIKVEMENTDGEVVTVIRDDGKGLSEEVLQNLFEPFAQGGKSAIDEREGLGLGLSLVKQLVDCHGGKVEAMSEGADKGSEFTVRLPASSGRARSRTEERELPTNGSSSLEILVVEDNKDSAEALGVLLRMWGHRAHLCHDGDRAVEEALERRPDVLLLDIDLPGRDGYSVLRSLRQQGFSTTNALAIAMTGFGRLGDMQQSAAAGFHHHLTKPAEPAALRRLLDEFAESRRSA